ncbi:transcription termination factor Rho [Longimicrobium sp.]|uniref:transcription termination factor Rho n=1 Tax=Longimicrobium sp. TaxID=2029185 RepID=UPI002E33CB5A|nr:transcription termination factor Rho [Longimicrobium sp.]HEX6038191.1 transcription termination factor Rho [Longimicrobium sp.]
MSLSAQPSAAARPASASEPTADGILEILPSGSGFLRTVATGYQAADGDVFVSQSVIRRLGLRTGDRVQGTIGTPPGRGKSPPLDEVVSVNGLDPAQARGRAEFGSLPATYPDERLRLELPVAGASKSRRDFTNRIIDLIAPLGKGQRALIVAPAKAGKTTVLQAIMNGIATNYPEAALMVLLVDERPEEVTEMQMLGIGEVIASSFDCPAERHVAVAEMVLEHARRLVESGRDVVIVLDSLTRLARAYNTTERGTGRMLSGGIDSGALEKPKRFFGSARKVRGGTGSLTIIATALIDTGSRGDEVIFEEFKGTGNSEIVLDRGLADRRIFPAIDIEKSATRREELLFPSEQLDKVYQLRRALHSLGAEDALQLLVKQMNGTETNDELLSRLR